MAGSIFRYSEGEGVGLGGGLTLILMLHCYLQNDCCFQFSRDVSHFVGLLTVEDNGTRKYKPQHFRVERKQNKYVNSQPKDSSIY